MTQSIELRDCVLFSAVIKVDNVEMGSYRALVSSAELMDHTEAEQLLKNNMAQEETAQITERSAAVLLQKAI